MSAPVNQSAATAASAPALPAFPNPLTTTVLAFTGSIQARELVAVGAAQRNVTIRPSRKAARAATITAAITSAHPSRPAYVEAAIAQAVGTAAVVPCGNCSRGGGNFVGCVVVPGVRLNGRQFLGGGCANCHFSDKRSRCFPENEEEEVEEEEDEEEEEDDGDDDDDDDEPDEEEKKERAERLNLFWRAKASRTTGKDMSGVDFDAAGRAISST